VSLHEELDSRPAIYCRALKKQYRSRSGTVDALKGLDLEIGRGECFGLLGPNGAGKTTAIEILEGLLEADSGEVTILGMRWGQNDDELRQRLQETRFAERLSVYVTLVLLRSFYRSGKDPAEVMAAVGLERKGALLGGHALGRQAPAASRAQRIETVSGLMNAIMLPMWLLSGIFFAPERFPDFMQPLVQALPLTQLNYALRAVILEGAGLLSQSWRLLVLAAWGCVSFVLALRWFRWN